MFHEFENSNAAFAECEIILNMLAVYDDNLITKTCDNFRCDKIGNFPFRYHWPMHRSGRNRYTVWIQVTSERVYYSNFEFKLPQKVRMEVKKFNSKLI